MLVLAWQEKENCSTTMWTLLGTIIRILTLASAQTGKWVPLQTARENSCLGRLSAVHNGQHAGTCTMRDHAIQMPHSAVLCPWEPEGTDEQPESLTRNHSSSKVEHWQRSSHFKMHSKCPQPAKVQVPAKQAFNQPSIREQKPLDYAPASSASKKECSTWYMLRHCYCCNFLRVLDPKLVHGVEKPASERRNQDTHTLYD